MSDKLFVKTEKSQKPYLYEVSKYAPQEALRNLDKAYHRFFKKLGKAPRFKKNGF
ncbi:MAG: hypothetical protein HC880_05570 [Bacteroidia bacterium]|nr:hypothetical protein [Bacteroidia bacterium]